MAKKKLDFSKALARFDKEVNAAVKSVTSDYDLLKEIADDVTKDMKQKTRSGKTKRSSLIRGKLTQTEPDYKQKLEPSTIANRKRLEKYNQPLHSAYGAAKNNLTYTGKLLDGIKYQINTSRQEIKIFMDGIHKGYKRKNRDGKIVTGDSISNEKLREYVEEGGRQFFFLKIDEPLLKKIYAKIKTSLRKKLKQSK